jgi:UDP-glucose 4-epimerase
MNSKKTILVTGGAGYIGSHTIIELLKNPDYHVISIDNHSNSYPFIYPKIEEITGRSFVHYPINLCDLNATLAVFSRHSDISGIIHFAAFKSVPDSVHDPLGYYHNNLESLNNVLRAAKASSVKQIIFSSSCSVYGNISKLPVTEETIFSKAESPYAYTKVVGERILEDFIRSEKGTQATILRYFNPVGAHPSGLLGEQPLGKPNNLVPIITQTAIGKQETFTVFGTDYNTRDGSCIRDYVHVSDIANAHVLALKQLDKSEFGCNTYNLGTGNGVSVLEAIHAFTEVSGIKPNYTIGKRRAGDVEAIYSDCSNVKKALNWEAAYSLRDMMDTAWRWELKLAQEAKIQK